MQSTKLAELIKRLGLDPEHIQEYQMLYDAAINECCLVVENAVFHKLPPQSYPQLIKEELL